MKRRIPALLAFLLTAFWPASPLFAQGEAGGVVQGKITDSTGAVILGVSVTLLNL